MSLGKYLLFFRLAGCLRFQGSIIIILPVDTESYPAKLDYIEQVPYLAILL